MDDVRPCSTLRQSVCLSVCLSARPFRPSVWYVRALLIFLFSFFILARHLFLTLLFPPPVLNPVFARDVSSI